MREVRVSSWTELQDLLYGGWNRWLRSHPEFCPRLIIAAGLKWEVRAKLDQANITERVLYPGLDGLSRRLRHYYGTGTPGEQRMYPPTPRRSARQIHARPGIE